MLMFRRLNLEDIHWAEADKYDDRLVYQTLPWLRFLERTQKAQPVVASISKDGKDIGFFTGLIVKKFGVRILGSPFHGWTTGYLGFNLLPGYSRAEAVKYLPEFAFDKLNCHYLQLADYQLAEEDIEGPKYTIGNFQNFEIDLTRTEDELFAKMNNDCRRRIRVAEKRSVTFEEASVDGFAEDYYAQLTDVFKKHSLVPTYGLDRVQSLLQYLYPEGSLVLARARNPEGVSIATGVFLAFNNTAFFWGGASWRQYQKQFTPNEGLMWFAMKTLKDRGIEYFDLGGWAPYKKKYGTTQVTRPFFMMSKPRILVPLKNQAIKGWYYAHRKLSKFKLHNRATFN